jgi:2-iminobutanoate/2-iminopropanoate deaminase
MIQTMPRQAVTAEGLAPPVGPFSPAIRAGGFIFLSGQVAIDPRTDKLLDGDVAAQTDQVFDNAGVLLQAAGKSFADVVKVNVFLADMADYAAMNAVYQRRFEPPHPARTTVAVAGLPLGAGVEIEFVAI